MTTAAEILVQELWALRPDDTWRMRGYAFGFYDAMTNSTHDWLFLKTASMDAQEAYQSGYEFGKAHRAWEYQASEVGVGRDTLFEEVPF